MRGRRLWVGGTRCILSNPFVKFFLELQHQKSRVFPCKLPSLISLFDILHVPRHTRDRVWGEQKVQSPEGEQSPCTREHCGLSHSLSCQTEGRKRRNTSLKISTGSVIYDDLCRALWLPLTTRAQWFPSSSLSFLPAFHSTFCFLSVYLSATFVVHLHIL